MNRFNSISITHSDMLRHAEDQLEWMRKNYPKMKLERRITPFLADHKLACQQAIVDSLKKSDPQKKMF